jgi:hypothetical protein
VRMLVLGVVVVWACLTAAAVCWIRKHVEGLIGRVELDTRGAKPRNSLFDRIVVSLRDSTVKGRG